MNESYFPTFEDAKKWASKSTNNVFTRSTDGNGFMPKKSMSTPISTPVNKPVYTPNPPYSGEIGQLYMVRKVTRQTAESMVSSATMQKLDENIRPGDELWEFTSSEKDWEYLAGRSGLSVIRNDEAIYQIVTMMS